MINGMILSGNVGLNDLSSDKIQLVNCPHKCRNCKLILFDINRLFHDSEQYHSSKEYHLSILCLKKAYYKTYEIREILEQECAKVFRLTILESLENIHQELKRMANGFFGKKRYKENYLLAEVTLNEFKQAIPAGKCENMQQSYAFPKIRALNMPAV